MAVEGMPIANNLWRVCYIHVYKQCDNNEVDEINEYMEYHNYVRICEVDDEIQENYMRSFHRNGKVCPSWITDNRIQQINKQGMITDICRGDIIQVGADMFIITKISPL